MQINKPLKLSKSFRYRLGHVDFSTATVGDMIEFLSQFPSEMPMVATWEGIHTAIKFDRVESGFNRGHEDDSCDTLIFDADQY